MLRYRYDVYMGENF